MYQIVQPPQVPLQPLILRILIGSQTNASSPKLVHALIKPTTGTIACARIRREPLMWWVLLTCASLTPLPTGFYSVSNNLHQLPVTKPARRLANCSARGGIRYSRSLLRVMSYHTVLWDNRSTGQL